MQLGKLNPVAALARFLVHQDVLTEFDHSTFAILLKPGQAKSVRGKPRDDVIQPITIDVVGVHLRTPDSERLARFRAEAEVMTTQASLNVTATR